MKSDFKLISLLLVQVCALYPVGAGLGLYRVTPAGIEFLIVQDPHQKQHWRKGFEFPAGTIGDSGHKAIDQLDGKKIDALSPLQKKEVPVSRYLRGAIREGLEELVFVPATYVLEGHAYTGSGKINTKFEAKAIDVVAQAIQDQGLIHLRALEGASNYTIFFWDVTNLPINNVLQEIHHTRRVLLRGWFRCASFIGAEPDAFAWVSAQELKKVIRKAQHEKNLNALKGTYYVVAQELVQNREPFQRNVSIKVSPGFVRLISKCPRSANSYESLSAIIQLLEKKHCVPIKKQ